MPASYPNYAADYAYLPGTELVTLTKDADGSTVANVVARKSSISVADIQAGAAAGVSPSDCVFTLWAGGSSLGSYRPRSQDRITRAAPAEVWQIVSNGIRSDDTQIRVVCRLMRANS